MKILRTNFVDIDLIYLVATQISCNSTTFPRIRGKLMCLFFLTKKNNMKDQAYQKNTQAITYQMPAEYHRSCLKKPQKPRYI